ncbi:MULTISPECIES: helix-turn-helix transcriptional regulator [unclassified Clostridium]|uniref:helix-turn-helix domain-containing protein n=1 Tax=unclassified Clostridium TaxID=2614128 RepID=UPI0032177994
MNKLGHKIKILRKAANLTQVDLSCDILNRTSLSKIENGNLNPSLPQLEHISDKLKISISDLISDDDISLLKFNFNNNKLYLKELYDNEKYFDIIDKANELRLSDFSSCYYLGMSYYKTELKKDAKKYLSKCEILFNRFSEADKYIYVENLCIALNSLRKIEIKSFSDDMNLKYLKKTLNYLNLYNHCKCEIYFIVNNNISAYYLFNEEYEKGINFIEYFLKNNIKINSPTMLCSFHLNLSIAYFSMKNYVKAIEYIKKSIFFYEYIGNNLEAGECYLNLFNSYLYNNQPNKCHELLEFLYKTYDDVRLINIYRVLELALVYNVNNIEKIINKSRYINYTSLRYKAKMDYDFILARANFIIGKYKVSLRHYNKCLKYLIQNKKYLDLYFAYKDMFSITENVNYELESINYKKLYDNEKYNHPHPNVTSPHYFSYINK